MIGRSVSAVHACIHALSPNKWELQDLSTVGTLVHSTLLLGPSNSSRGFERANASSTVALHIHIHTQCISHTHTMYIPPCLLDPHALKTFTRILHPLGGRRHLPPGRTPTRRDFRLALSQRRRGCVYGCCLCEVERDSDDHALLY
jgi:hypothetical protein